MAKKTIYKILNLWKWQTGIVTVKNTSPLSHSFKSLDSPGLKIRPQKYSTSKQLHHPRSSLAYASTARYHAKKHTYEHIMTPPPQPPLETVLRIQGKTMWVKKREYSSSCTRITTSCAHRHLCESVTAFDVSIYTNNSSKIGTSYLYKTNN